MGLWCSRRTHWPTRRAARVGYLGSSDSPVRLRVSTDQLSSAVTADAFTPNPDGDVLINVAQAGDLHLWDRLHEQWTERGASVSRSQHPILVHPVRYQSPRQAERRDRGEVVAWLRHCPLSGASRCRLQAVARTNPRPGSLAASVHRPNRATDCRRRCALHLEAHRRRP